MSSFKVLNSYVIYDLKNHTLSTYEDSKVEVCGDCPHHAVKVDNQIIFYTNYEDTIWDFIEGYLLAVCKTTKLPVLDAPPVEPRSFEEFLKELESRGPIQFKPHPFFYLDSNRLEYFFTDEHVYHKRVFPHVDLMLTEDEKIGGISIRGVTVLT